MKQKIIKTQKQLNAIKKNYDGTIYIEGGTDNTPLILKVNFEFADVVTRGSCHIEMLGNSQVNRMLGNSQVKEMWENSQVNRMLGNSQVKEMWGEASISAYGTQKIICKGYNVIRIRKSNEKNCSIVLSKTSHLIIIPDPKPTFKDYQKRYPIKIKGKKAILYKAVHKKKTGTQIEYFSDYDRNFKYEKGKTVKVECNKSIDVVCSYGIHVFHKHGAISWGNGWEDFALLECEVPINKIIVPNNNDGKIRTSELKVIKEIKAE